MKKTIYRTALLCAAFISVLACSDRQPVDFDLDADVIEIGPEGGIVAVNVSSEDSWIATVQEPWITVSPANGIGSAECRIIIDSALARLSSESKTRRPVTEKTLKSSRKDSIIR